MCLSIPVYTTHSLRGGISYPFTNISFFKNYYQQAVKSLEYGIRLNLKESLIAYIDIASFDLVVKSSNTSEYSQQMLHPTILRVIEYDKEKGTNIFRDLSSYVEHSRNIKACSEDLGIKWTSMKNKINRIQELFSINLKDHDVISELYFSAKVESILRKFHGNSSDKN